MLAACRRPTFLQSRQYAAALARTEGWHADFGLIRFNGKPIGIVQVQVRGWLPFLRTCRIHRGPVWIHDEIPGEMLKLVLRMLRRRYHLLAGRPLLFHPELADTEANRLRLEQCGFRRRAEGYRTIWLDLSVGLDALRAGLGQKWRNALSGAERHGLALAVDAEGGLFDWLMGPYLEDKLRRGYVGPSPAFLRVLYEVGDASRPIILQALHAGSPVAGILLVRHGRAATYQVGWTSEEGRRLRAHHFLLWNAVVWLKRAGMAWLDLGGVNGGDAAGIARFKAGMGGQPVTLAGGYV